MQEQKNELRGDNRTVSPETGALSKKAAHYERLFLLPVKTAALHGKAIYVRPAFHQRIQRIVRLLDNDKISMTAIWTACWNTTSQPSTTNLRSGAAIGSRLFPGILKRHCHGNSQCRTRTFERMLARFEEFARRMDALCHTHRIGEPEPWLDNQQVCQLLNISKRTL